MFKLILILAAFAAAIMATHPSAFAADSFESDRIPDYLQYP
ncbi:hypothetical protein [Cupriavidus sp. 8B]